MPYPKGAECQVVLGLNVDIMLLVVQLFSYAMREVVYSDIRSGEAFRRRNGLSICPKWN